MHDLYKYLRKWFIMKNITLPFYVSMDAVFQSSNGIYETTEIHFTIKRVHKLYNDETQNASISFMIYTAN
jgi:hypothetical protein